jgi:hypothetical protein
MAQGTAIAADPDGLHRGLVRVPRAQVSPSRFFDTAHVDGGSVTSGLGGRRWCAHSRLIRGRRRLRLTPPSERRGTAMTCIRCIGLAAAIVSLLYVSVTVRPAFADEETPASIVYSDTYWRLIVEFPSGQAPNACEIAAFLSGGGLCEARFDPVYFYPDGTVGTMAWFADPASPTGWSIEPDPCTGLTGDDYALWSTYVDFTNGYLDAGPSLTDEQIDQYGACWGWWF